MTESAAARAEKVAKEAEHAAEEAVAKAEAAVPAALVRKVIASWEFKIFLVIVLLASIMSAITISVALSILSG